MITDGIYVTLGKDQVKERGYKTYLKQFAECDGERLVYYWRLATKPQKEFKYVYIVIGNKVRFRATFIGYDTGYFVFSDGSHAYGNIWLQLINFERLPKPYEHKKGFQGIRYKN